LGRGQIHGGYPITLQFPPFDKVTDVIAKLTDATGNSVQFFLSDPEHPATSFGQFGVICLIPKQSLQAQHAYTVRHTRPRSLEASPRMPALDGSMSDDR
jgi:hypothetical protein